MIKLFGALILILGTQAQASVWDDMTSQASAASVSRLTGKVTSLEVSGTGVSVQMNVDGLTKSFQASAESVGACNSAYHSDEERVAFFTQRVQALRDAFQQGDAVEVSFTGPWNPCLNSVKVFRKI